MPYIEQQQRNRLNTVGEPLDAGELNYVITRAVDDYLRKRGVRYASLNEAIGVLECAKLELYRRVAGVYEDEKIATNGDVYGCR